MNNSYYDFYIWDITQDEIEILKAYILLLNTQVFLRKDVIKLVSSEINKEKTYTEYTIIGYKISEAVHHNKYIVGETDTLWSFNMIFSDVNFYLILALGFATYILWGICLHQVLSHPALKTLDEVTKEHIKKMDEKIAFEEKLVLEVDQMILSRTQQIYSIKEKINKLQQEIIDIRKGMVSININTIKGYVGAFKNGWITFLTNSQGNQK